VLVGLDDVGDQGYGDDDPCYLQWWGWPENEHHDHRTQIVSA